MTRCSCRSIFPSFEIDIKIKTGIYLETDSCLYPIKKDGEIINTEVVKSNQVKQNSQNISFQDSFLDRPLSETLVLIYLFFMRKKKRVFPSHGWVAAHLGYKNRRTPLRAFGELAQEGWLSWTKRPYKSNIYHLDPIFHSPEFKEFIDALLGKLSYQPQVLRLLRILGKKNAFPSFHLENVTRMLFLTLGVLTTKIKTIKGRGEEGSSPTEPTIEIYVDPPPNYYYVNYAMLAATKDPLLGEDTITPLPLEFW